MGQNINTRIKMAKAIPTKLYKYQAANNPHTIDNLRNCHLWFSKPYRFNDPFDSAIRFSINGSDADYQSLFNELVHRLTELGDLSKIEEVKSQFLTDGKVNKKFEDAIKNEQSLPNDKKIAQFAEMGIACFAERLDNLLMWSHYAEGHRGLCLEFDTSFWPFNDQRKLLRFIYSNSFPPLSPLDILQSTALPIDPLITKSKGWFYEEEWRLIMEKGDLPFEYDP